MKKKLTILIPNATSPRNVGDQAMLDVLLSLLSRKYANAKIVIHSIDPELYEKKKNIEVLHTLYSWAVFARTSPAIRVIRLFYLCLSYIQIRLRLPLFSVPKDLRRLLSDYKNADFIFFAGGGYLRSKKGLTQTLNLFMQLVPFYFAKLHQPQIIVAPVSFGPFAASWQERLTAWVIKDASLIAIREHHSFKLLKQYVQKNIISASDYALLLTGISKRKNKSKKIVLGFTIKNWLEKKTQQRFEDEFAKGIKTFVAQTGVAVQPIVQVNNEKYGDIDILVTKKIVHMLQQSNISVYPTKILYDVKDAKQAYKSVDLLLGMRMHSNIIAATQGTPFVGVAYEHKTEGIARQLGLADYCIHSAVVTEKKLVTLLMKLYKNRKTLRRKLLLTIERIQELEQKRWDAILHSLQIVI